VRGIGSLWNDKQSFYIAYGFTVVLGSVVIVVAIAHRNFCFFFYDYYIVFHICIIIIIFFFYARKWAKVKYDKRDIKMCVCVTSIGVYRCVCVCIRGTAGVRERKRKSVKYVHREKCNTFSGFLKNVYAHAFFLWKKTHINQKQITKFIVYNKSCKNLIPKLIFFFLISVFRIKIKMYTLVIKYYFTSG